MKFKIAIIILATFFLTTSNINAQDSATSLLEKAQIKAKKENKKIFVKFEASWCGWCHRMTKNMKAESTKDFFNDNFILLPLVVFESPKNKKLENPGAEDLIKKFNNGKSRVGLPFWFILDTDLNLVSDSYDANKQNLGCPASKEEVDEFIKKLKTIVPTMKESDIANIKKQFIISK